MDREMKSQERGLRNRIKPNGERQNDQGVDENLENRQPNLIQDGIFEIEKNAVLQPKHNEGDE